MSVSNEKPDVHDRRHAVRLGAGFVAACSFVVLCTVWFLPVPDREKGIAAALAGAAVVLGAALIRLPWEKWPAEALLAFPLLGASAIGAGALLTSGITPVYTGFFVVGFVYLGLTQSRKTTLAVVPLAIPAWVLCQGGLTATVGVKLPVTAGIWMLVGLNLATRTARSAKRTGELVLAASTDSLTGLSSRGELEHIVQRLSSGDAVILLDIDHFKSVNDEQGHRAGDLVLAAFGHAVRSAMRTGDRALRFGGDEVLVVLPAAASSGAEAMLNRLRERWTAFPYPSFSAGVAVHDGRVAEETLERADEALYVAKREGRDRWQFHGDKEHHNPVSSVPVPADRPGERVLTQN